MISPRLVKGGLVQVDAESGTPTAVIAMQYNPDQLTRTLQVQASGQDGGRSQALRLKGPAVETLKLDAEIDATDDLEHPAEHATAVEVGIHPQLAALELLVHPRADDLQTVHQLAGSGTLEILPPQQPLTLFVWSSERVVPVRVTDLSITEEAFAPNLNPIRARISLTMRVLSVDDLGHDGRGGALYMGHLRSKEGLAGRARSAALSALGVEGDL